MRVRRCGGERSRGAVALMASVSLIAIFGFTAISVDLGNAWQTRRNLVNATDAAALAAAQEYAMYGNGCTSVAGTYVANNMDAAVMTACNPSESAVNNDTSGYVTVSAQNTIDYAFAPIIGVDSATLSSTTVARYGIPLAVGGLRPFGLCYDTLLNTPQYTNWDPSSGLPSDPVLIDYDKSGQPSACNSGDPVPGDWATLDFDGGENSNADITEWTLNGYPDLVAPGVYPGDTGAFSPSLATELQILEDSGLIFPLPLFDSATGTGSNAMFNVVGYISVRITDFKTSGAQASRSLTLEFHTSLVRATCCDESGIDTGTRVVQICAVDPDEASDCVIAAPTP